MTIIFITLLLSVCIIGCSDESDTIVVVVKPSLPKIDCREHVGYAMADLANRGLAKSSAADRVRNRERKWCDEENERRGY